MIYQFHPAAEAEFLESVGFYESRVAGLGGALIEEFEALVELICSSPRAWPVEAEPDIHKAPLHRFPCRSFTAKRQLAYRFLLSPMIVAVRNTGSADFNKVLWPDNFPPLRGSKIVASPSVIRLVPWML